MVRHYRVVIGAAAILCAFAAGTSAQTFAGPSTGGGWSGTVNGATITYNGVSYQLVNGRVSFPNCMTYVVAPNGALAGGAATPRCTPADGGFRGPANGGGWSCAISGPTITYNGVKYPIENGRVRFPNCMTYVVAPNGALAGGAPTPNCTPVGGVVDNRPPAAAGAFRGPSTGGGWSGTVSGSTLTYNGVKYPIENGRVHFPNCMTYIVGGNGSLNGGAPTPNCTPVR